jgi:hypothetical protein
MEVELTIYLDENAESFDFNGVAYTEESIVKVNMGESYPISVNPKSGKSFEAWYQYGVLFEDVYSQNTMCVVMVEDSANCIGSIK